MEDLPVEEQAAYQNRPTVIRVPQQPVKEQQYVPVAGRDYLAEGFQQALAAEAKSNPHLRSVVQRVEYAAQHLADSARSSDRIFSTYSPRDIVVKH